MNDRKKIGERIDDTSRTTGVFKRRVETGHPPLNIANTTPPASGAREKRTTPDDADPDGNLLLACVVHDIKNAIATVVYNFEVLESGDFETCEEGQIRHDIALSLQSVLLMADQALTVNRAKQSKRIPLKETPKKNISVSKFFHRSLGPFAKYCNLVNPLNISNFHGFENQLSRAVLNLVNNAVKHSGHDEDAKIEILLDEDENFSYINIKDHGPGLPENHQDIFQPYRRGETTEVSGYGIGLASTRIIMEEHGGSVSARNNDDGPGCTFTLLLPKT